MTLDKNNPLYKCPACGSVTTIAPQKKAKMLFVDDRTKRIHYALENFPEYDVTIATCVLEALRQMCAHDWDVISLDHDFRGSDFQDPDMSTCGMEIVRYIEKTGWPSQRKRPKIWVHSSNLFAAHLMRESLAKLGFFVESKRIVYEEKNVTFGVGGIKIINNFKRDE